MRYSTGSRITINGDAMSILARSIAALPFKTAGTHFSTARFFDAAIAERAVARRGQRTAVFAIRSGVSQRRPCR